MLSERAISYMPGWAAPLVEPLAVRVGVTAERDARCDRPRDWPAFGVGMARAQRALAALPVARIVELIDEVSRRWSYRDFPARMRAVADVVEVTGFSREAVERSFDVELRNYRADSLARALVRELGTPVMLDGFVPDCALGGMTRAVGPRITLAIFTGNVPGLPALSIVRALLVKSAVIAKVASGEPTFAAHFARTIAEVSPVLGDALAVTYWTRDDDASLRAAAREADAVIAYGSDEACAVVRAVVGPRTRYVEHGHKLSVGIVARDYLALLGAAEVARRIAVDVSTFNQHACIAPQAYVIEGDVAEVRRFAGEVARALDEYAAVCPLGVLDEAQAASLQLARAGAAWAAATRPDRALFCGEALDWTVVLDSGLKDLSGGGNRVLRIVPCGNLRQAVALLEPLGAHLQNVGLGAFDPALAEAATALAEIGACRVCEPGHMAEPSMIWRHDGEPCLARLVRFCDIEHHRGAGAVAIESDSLLSRSRS